MVKSSEIFYGFCTHFSSLGITTKPTPSMWKYRVLQFFDTLGRMLGYEVYTEDTFTKGDHNRKLTRKRIDMTWVDPGSRNYVLALEYENTDNINDEIEKLSFIYGFRVLVMFKHGFSIKEIIRRVRSQLNKTGEQESDFLVLVLPNNFVRATPFEKLRAVLLNAKGITIGLGSAEGYVSANGVCGFKKTKWVKSRQRIAVSRKQEPA